MEKTYELLSTGGSTEFVAGKLKELTDRQADLTGRLTAKEADQLEFNARDSRFYSSREDIRDLVVELQKPLFKMRLIRCVLRYAARLKVLVETLLVAPQGDLPKMKRNIEQLLELNDSSVAEVIAHMQQVAAHPDQFRRYFAVVRDAAVRAAFRPTTIPSYSNNKSWPPRTLKRVGPTSR